VKKRWVSTTLTLLCVLSVAAPAAAAEDDDDAQFTGETVTAQTTAETVETCRDPDVAPLLRDFGDDDLYFVAPGGDFESGVDGWTLESGASIGSGSNAFAPLGSGSASLRLPEGAAATSPAFCVDERFPTFRVTIGQLGSRKARVRVSVVYPGLEQNVRKEADVDADEKHPWKLSKRLNLHPGHGRKVGGWRLVALRFETIRAQDGADARIDDVVVDPRLRY
jgi:hypothetical protein